MRRLVLLALGILALSAAPASAEKRVALVIGNNDYPRLKTDRDPLNGQLVKAVADAEAVGEALTSLGFDVDIGRNVDRVAFLTLLDRVKRKIAPGDTVFIFFAGHGVAFRGSNLLLPSDIPPVDPEGEQLIRGLAVAETDIIDTVRERGAGLTVLALDACRDNPIEEFARAQARAQGRSFRSSSMRAVGLDARPTSGVFSIYSAGIGQKALDGLQSDGAERNSVFTRVFVKKLVEPGRHLADIMEDVKEDVSKLAATTIDHDTGQPHRQFPAYYNETQGGRVFLAGAPPNLKDDSKSSRPSVIDPAERAWAITQNTASIAVLEEFIRQFGASPYAAMAQARLAEIKRTQVPVAANPAPASQVAALPRAPVAASAKTRTYRVNDNVSQGILNIRAGAGPNYPVVTAIPAGAADVAVGNCRPADSGQSTMDWCEVQWRGSAGWASSCCMTEVKSGARRVFRILDNVSDGILNIRNGPGRAHALVVGIPAGASDVSVGRCKIPDEGGAVPWCEVEWRGRSGWASGCCMIDTKTSAYARAGD